MKGIKLHFGGLAKTLEKQLESQGYTLGEKAKRYEDINKSVTKIFFFGLLTPSELEKIRNKLIKDIAKNCKEIEVKK